MEAKQLQPTAELNEIRELHALINGIAEAQRIFLTEGDHFMEVTSEKIKAYRQKAIERYKLLEARSPEFKPALENAIRALQEIDK